MFATPAILAEENRRKVKKRKFVIEEVILKDKDKTEPVFATFSNGKPAEDAGLTGTVLKGETSIKTSCKQRIFSVETPKMTYVGKNFGLEALAESKELLFLGIADKTTGKMRLVETSSFTVYPQLMSRKALNPDLQDPTHSLTLDEEIEQVALRFGTKKSKIFHNRRKQYQVKAEDMALVIDQAAATVEVKEEDLELDSGKAESFLSILPPCNREATRPEDVYKLELIAPDYFLACLEESARALLEEGAATPEGSSLFKHLLVTAKLEPNDEKQVRLACLALYVHHLLTFLNLRSKSMNKFFDEDECPRKIRAHIANSYTQGQGKKRTRTPQDEDCIICCILVLSLIVSKYHLSIKTLLDSLPLKKERLNLLMKAVGATYRPDSQSYVLKIPLATFGKPFYDKKRK